MSGADGERRVAVVTGGASGIGQAVAARLLADGCDVALVDVNADAVDAAADALQRGAPHAGAVLPLVLDIRDSGAVDRCFDTVERWRRAPDALVNSAGIMTVLPLLDCSAEAFRRVLDVNVLGSFLCAQRAARGMVARRHGRIVNLSSISGTRAGVGRVAYGTSKAAVSALTRQLAMELGAFGITANALAPGPVATPMTESQFTPSTRRAYVAMIPARRFGTPEEIAHAAAFLCSVEAGYINGVTLAVDGGYLAAGVAVTGDMASEQP